MRPGAIAEGEGRGYPENLCIKLHQGTSPYIKYLKRMAYDWEHVGYRGILVWICMAFLSVTTAA